MDVTYVDVFVVSDAAVDATSGWPVDVVMAVLLPSRPPRVIVPDFVTAVVADEVVLVAV